AAAAHLARPGGFTPVIDERREHDGDVAFGRRTGRSHDLMAGAPGQRGGVGEMHAGQVVKTALEGRDDTRDSRERPEAGSVPARDRVFTDETNTTTNICQNNAHDSPLAPPREARLQHKRNE